MNQITIKNITYNIIMEQTIEQIEATMPNLTAEWKRKGIVAMLRLERPKGKVANYMAYRLVNGSHTSATRI